MSGDPVRSRTVAHQEEGKVVDPVRSTLVRSTGHSLKRGVESLDGAHRFVVFGGAGGEIDSRLAADFLSQFAGEIGSQV